MAILNIRREGRAWTDEALERYERTPEKIEMFGGKLFSSDEERLAMLGLLLENMGADAAVRLGDPSVWRAATASLEHEPAERRSSPIVPSERQSEGRDAERTLLRRMREDHTQLQALLESSSDHWGFEDPIYRFYHQSFKVFSLQDRTEAIVRQIVSLLPGRPLDPTFVDIVREGTGRTFTLADNERWREVTGPIVEAFLHARFFLEMAVRYATLDGPPSPLPSGYAALLHLYQLR
jgi:hypothetical protein